MKIHVRYVPRDGDCVCVDDSMEPTRPLVERALHPNSHRTSKHLQTCMQPGWTHLPHSFAPLGIPRASHQRGKLLFLQRICRGLLALRLPFLHAGTPDVELCNAAMAQVIRMFARRIDNGDVIDAALVRTLRSVCG